METIEEIFEAMTALTDLADSENRDLTAEEVGQYEKHEKALKTKQASAHVRARQSAYTMTVVPAGVPQPRRADREDQGERTDLDRAFEAYLRTGQPNQDISGLRVQMAQSEGGSAAGGYLVPQGFRDKLVEVRKSFGGFGPEAETINTDTGAPLEYPSNDDTANTGDITAESAAISSGNDLVFGTVALGAYKYTSAGAGSNLALRVPVELIQDSQFDIEALISRKLGQRIQRKQAPHWVTGTGVGQPQGILASSLTSDYDLTTPDTLSYNNLVNFQDLLDEEYDANAKWLMRRNTWAQVRLLVDTTGRPLVQSSTEGIAGRPERRLLDRPVVIDEAAPLLSSAAITYPIAYGDFRESYVIRRVHSLVIVVNPWNRATNGEVEYSAWERADGAVQNRSSYKILRNNT